MKALAYELLRPIIVIRVEFSDGKSVLLSESSMEQLSQLAGNDRELARLLRPGSQIKSVETRRLNEGRSVVMGAAKPSDILSGQTPYGSAYHSIHLRIGK